MDFLPVGPHYGSDSDGENAHYATGNQGEDRQKYLSGLEHWRESAKEEAYKTADLNPEKEAAARYMRALGGEYWDRRRAKYKSKVFDNRLNNSRITDLSLLTQTRPTIDISTKIDAYKGEADIVSKVIRSEWLTRDMDAEFIRVNDITKLNGTGFWKIGAASPGMMQAISCGPDSVFPIQPGFHLQNSTAILYKTWKALSYFRNKFPYGCAGIEKELSDVEQGAGGAAQFTRPKEYPEYTWERLSPAMRRSVGIRIGSGDIGTSVFKSLEMQEYYVDDPQVNESKNKVLMRHPYLPLTLYNWWYWVNPGERLYPRKRLLVFAGRRLMYDGPAPFWHGLFPFATLRLNPVPWSFWGLSKYRDLLPLNEGMNEIIAGILDMVRRALNPTVVTKAGAVPQATWREFYPDMPGARLYMLPNSNPQTDVRYIAPPEIPAWVMQAHQYLSMEFDRLAGIVDPGALGKKKQVPGGDTIEQMREMLNTPTQLESRYGELFLRNVGVQAMSNVFQYFELPMRLRLLGKDGISLEDFNYEGPNLIPDHVTREDHWKNFSMMITPGSLLGSSRDREKQTAINMAAKGLLPLQYLWSVLELNPKQLMEMLKQEHEMGIGAKAPKPSGQSAPKMTGGQKTGNV